MPEEPRISKSQPWKERERMKGKEEKFWEALYEASRRSSRAGAVMFAVMTGGDPCSEEELAEICRESWEAQIALLEEAHRLFRNESVWEASCLLLAHIFALPRDMRDMAKLFQAAGMEAPGRLSELGKLDCRAAEELEKIFGYAPQLEENYMKAEARCQRIRNYEKRGEACLREGMKALFTPGVDPAALILWKEGYERAGALLEKERETADLFQHVARHLLL